jgi:sulfite reductase alpha subunit-like flavoprotein
MSLSSSKKALFVGLAVSIVIPVALGAYVLYRNRNVGQITVGDSEESLKNPPVSARQTIRRKILILYATTTGTSKMFAGKLAKRISSSSKIPVVVCDVQDFNEDNLELQDIVFLICSTWTDGLIPEKCEAFYQFLKDAAFDFRVGKNMLANVKYSTFGLGGEIYKNNFCKAVLRPFN